ncbi:sensory histidine kinase DcuS [Clostridium liquoris]|jgi:sensor histidine kinase regulating citrate/malate metabolism|uniref:Sensory histidine kinase DcuS n=1 Tax=Clostridium liquoris TaxID=1289519 RepID=A0A2T0B111_9CLOT|nr:Spo0B domain-containing protein [Clostridium liquoris]PRR77289.1 sensory histidine kinase DcuS [Clostridium liquoris]
MGDLYKLIESLRVQRHDFMNDLQIIYGYLQVDKEDKAKEYIDKLSVQNKYLSEIYSLGDLYLGYSLEKNIKECSSKHIEINIDIEISKLSKKPFDFEYNKKINLVNNIFNELEKNEPECIYIYIFEDSIGESVFISNNNSMIDEINWMESWSIINTSIDDIKVYKCEYGDNLAYRLVF